MIIKQTLCSRNITKKVCNFDNIEYVLIFNDDDDDDDNKKKQSKLIQCGHASSNNLKSLLKNAGYIDKEV